MKKIAIFLILTSIILISACGPKCPSCPEAGTWSACSEEVVKTRTSYKCGEETNFECQSFEETKDCARQIIAKGRYATMTISPSIEKEVKGIITLEATNVPDETDYVSFAIQGKGIPDLREIGPNIGIDTHASDGWNYLFDTTTYDNGIYDLFGIVIKEGRDPLDGIQAQVIIKN